MAANKCEPGPNDKANSEKVDDRAAASEPAARSTDDTDAVEEALRESFPASDPPAWTLGDDQEPVDQDAADTALDEASSESFPASDAPAWTTSGRSRKSAAETDAEDQNEGSG